MSDTKRFRRRRQLLQARGLCTRCGQEKAIPGMSYGEMCATEMRTKKILRPAAVFRCEKIARLERNLAFCREAEKTIVEQLSRLRVG
jgi:hypothetical protein